MERNIDFTNCKIDTSANYGGSDKKRGILYNNSRYMLKGCVAGRKISSTFLMIVKDDIPKGGNRHGYLLL